MTTALTLQYFIKLLFYGCRQFGFGHGLPVYGLTGCNQASPGSGFDFFLVATGARAAAKNHHYVDIIFRQRHQMEIPLLLSYPGQMTGYPPQVNAGIAGTAILQGYLEFTTVL